MHSPAPYYRVMWRCAVEHILHGWSFPTLEEATDYAHELAAHGNTRIVVSLNDQTIMYVILDGRRRFPHA